MICKNCGRENEDNVKFCAFCGFGVDESATQESSDSNVVIQKQDYKLTVIAVVIIVVIAIIIGLVISTTSPSNDSKGKETVGDNAIDTDDELESELDDMDSDEIVESDKEEPSDSNNNASVSETKLSEECDIVLASGYDSTNNFYELIANETEDYIQTTIEIGVIKNNKWLLKPTSNHPFLDENSHFIGDLTVDDMTLYRARYFQYIGGSIFQLNSQSHTKGVLYNAENNLSVDMENDYLTDGQDAISYKNNPLDEGYLLYVAEGKNLYVLNVNTMESRFIREKRGGVGIYPYSDGVFCVREDSNYKFYNLNNELVLDLSQYNIYESYSDKAYPIPLIFKKGQCYFYVKNDQGTIFRITVNKSGDVLSTEKIY